MATTSRTVTATSTIPYVYRFLLNNVEPAFAFNGAVLVHFNPFKYVSSMARHSIQGFDDSTQFIYTELAGAWLYFAFTEAIVLRLVDNISVWRLLCMGMLLSDIAYCHSCAQAVGGWTVWLQITSWTPEDWIVTLTTWPFVLTRVAIVLGIGLRLPSREGTKQE